MPPMATIQSVVRPSSCWKSLCSELNNQQIRSVRRRFLTTFYSPRKEKLPFPENFPKQFGSQIPPRFRPWRESKVIVNYPPPDRPASKEPLKDFTNDQLAVLDPTGERKALFDYKNTQGAKVGDILRVTFKNGDPFAGVCINIRSRGIDTSFLLRNTIMRVPVEMWIKVFSPNTQSVEIVQRSQRKVRRARLTYMRKPKHDPGNVDNIVLQYLRKKAALAANQERERRRK